jgi:hypothetical protein
MEQSDNQKGTYGYDDACEIYLHNSRLLMNISEEVIYSLYRIKGAQRNFYEDGIPIAHSSIPKTR